MLEIYYGEAKGKSRLAAGAAMIAALRDRNVLLVCFDDDNGSQDRLFDIAPNITRLTLPRDTAAREFFDHAVRTALAFPYNVLILDGVFDAVNAGRLSAADVYEFLSNAPDRLEIIGTGRTAGEKFLAIADEAVKMTPFEKETE